MSIKMSIITRELWEYEIKILKDFVVKKNAYISRGRNS
jgi:hypothetical protein